MRHQPLGLNQGPVVVGVLVPLLFFINGEKSQFHFTPLWSNVTGALKLQYLQAAIEDAIVVHLNWPKGHG